MPRARTTACALALALGVLVTLHVVLVARHNFNSARHLAWLAIAPWVLSLWLLSRLRLSSRAAAALVLGVSALLMAVALTGAPRTSDDDYRYVWDATVQLHGTDPYRYAPSDPALTHLREPWLFGAQSDCRYAFPGGCTAINRPTVHTVYPPVAEAAFTLVRVVSGGAGHRRPLQVAGALGSLLVGWLLLRRCAGRPWRAAVWAWCPLVISEYANNAHIDWLAVLLVLAAFSRRVVPRTGLAAVLVGAAAAVKIYPGLVLASLMRGRPVLAVGAALGFVALTYVPHVIAAGSAVLGYLPGYLHEEDYGNGKRLLLLGSVLPHPLDTVVGAAVLLAVGLWAWRRGDPLHPERTAVVTVGTALLVFTPSYPWYGGLLIALVALTGALEWLPVALAATFVYLDRSGLQPWFYLAAATLAGGIAVLRHPDTVRACLRSISASTDR